MQFMLCVRLRDSCMGASIGFFPTSLVTLREMEACHEQGECALSIQFLEAQKKATQKHEI
jgi:hypothetical protein